MCKSFQYEITRIWGINSANFFLRFQLEVLATLPKSVTSLPPKIVNSILHINLSDRTPLHIAIPSFITTQIVQKYVSDILFNTKSFWAKPNAVFHSAEQILAENASYCESFLHNTYGYFIGQNANMQYLLLYYGDHEISAFLVREPSLYEPYHFVIFLVK